MYLQVDETSFFCPKAKLEVMANEKSSVFFHNDVLSKNSSLLNQYILKDEFILPKVVKKKPPDSDSYRN